MPASAHGLEDADLGRHLAAARHGEEELLLLGHEQARASAGSSRDLLLRLPRAGSALLEDIEEPLPARGIDAAELGIDEHVVDVARERQRVDQLVRLDVVDEQLARIAAPDEQALLRFVER